MDHAVEITVFGSCAAAVGGRSVDLGGVRPRAVLAALVAAGPAGLSQDAIVEAVWGATAPATARKAVQKYVSTLRAVLGERLIETHGDRYSLAAELASIDVEAFAGLAQEARSHAIDENWDDLLIASEAALSLFRRGTPYSDIVEESPLRSESSSLAERALNMAELQLDALLGLGRPAEAAAAAEELVSREPLREQAWARMMLALYRMGRQSDALRSFRRVELILADELGIEPSVELRDLEQRILDHADDLAGSERRPTSLPSPYTSFVGRDQEMDQLAEMLASTRLVTVIGTGGSGKTRLVLEMANTLDDLEAWFVDLAQVSDPAHVVAVVAEALGIAAEPGAPPADVVGSYVSGRNAVLLLDNCEHVAGAVAALVHTVLQSSKTVRVIATSREPLGLTGEAVFSLQPLELPSGTTSADAGESGAVRLFVDRAMSAYPDFEYADQWEAVVAICHSLAGIPLAIELAARQLAVLGVDDLRAGLAEGIDRLTAPGDPVPRHRTLEAAIAWSHDRLDPSAQRLFAGLSAFPGSFTRDAAMSLWEIVDGAVTDPEHFDRLVAASMVSRSPAKAGFRYRVLEPIRAYGARSARRLFPPEHASRAHALWVLDELERDPHIVGPNERATLARLRAEDHHFPVALGWATQHEPELALRLTIAATSYLWMVDYRFVWFDEIRNAIEAGRGAPRPLMAKALANAAHSLAENLADHVVASQYASEALELLSQHDVVETRVTALLALASASRNAGDLSGAIRIEQEAVELADRSSADLWAVRGTRWMAFAEMQRGNYDRALQLSEEAKQRAIDLGSDWVAAKSMWVAAAVLALDGRYDEAENHAARAFELFEGYDDPASPVHVRAVQGDAARLGGDSARALPIYEECLDRFRDVGDRRCAASTHRNLGLVCADLGDHRAAHHHLIASLRQRSSFGDEAGIAECLEGLALTLAMNEDDEGAAELISAGEVLRRRAGSRPPEPERSVLEASMSGVKSRLSSEAFDRAADAGRLLAGSSELFSDVSSRWPAPDSV